jgi:hypothetical protein
MLWSKNKTANLLNPNVNQSEAALNYVKGQTLVWGSQPLFNPIVWCLTSAIGPLYRQNIASAGFFKAATAIIHMESNEFFAITYIS